MVQAINSFKMSRKIQTAAGYSILSLEVIELQFNNINTEDDMPAAGENFGFFVFCIEFGALFQQWGDLLVQLRSY